MAVEKGMSRAERFADHAEPEEAPKGLNEDITRLNIAQVGQLHQYYTGMLAYMMVECARADMRHTAAKSSYTHLMKLEKFKLASDKVPMWQIEAQLEEIPEIKAAYQKVLEAEAFKTLVAAKTKGIELKAQMSSREITRRSTEREHP